MPKVQVLKPHMHTDGKIVHPGDTVEISDVRRAELAANGLVAPAADRAAAAPPSARIPGEITSGALKPRRRSLVGQSAAPVANAPEAQPPATPAKAKASKAKPRARQRKPAGG